MIETGDGDEDDNEDDDDGEIQNALDALEEF